MKKYLISFGFFIATATHNLSGQSLPPIQLDRPDQTECPFITPAKFIQIENGFTIENSYDHLTIYIYPSTLWKYGVNEKFELRLITELVTLKSSEKTVTGFLPINLGFKTSLVEEKGIVPKISFIGHLTTAKIGSRDFETKYIVPSFRFTMQHTLSNKVSLAYNLGTEWDGEVAEPTYIYTLTTGISLTDKMGCYAELFGFIQNESSADHRFDCGFTYLITDNFIADISGGLGFKKETLKNYISIGVSYRFKTIK